jgi:hypothetical protein
MQPVALALEQSSVTQEQLVEALRKVQAQFEQVIHIHVQPGGTVFIQSTNGSPLMRDNNIDNSTGPTGSKAIGTKSTAINYGDVAQQTVKGDFASVAAALSNIGVADADIAALKAAINADPPSLSGSGFGTKVSTWLGTMVSKAANGAWEIGVAVAGDVLAKIISRFYGLG